MGATQIWDKKNGMQNGHINPNTKERKTRIKKIVGTLIYYERVVGYTIMLALGSIYVNKSKSNKTTNQAIKQLLDYCDTHPYTTI